jgi:hypothetical protein
MKSAVTKRVLAGAGRDGKGRFQPGNQAASGHQNHRAKRIQRFAEIILTAVSEDDFRQVVKALIVKAKSGDTVAVRELLDRLIGKVVSLEPEALDVNKVIRIYSPLTISQKPKEPTP